MSGILTGDCIDVMAGMEPESVDAIVTDPPYGLEFMGKEWDSLARDEHGNRLRSKEDPFATRLGQQRGGGDPFIGKGIRFAAGAPMQDWHHAWATAALRVAKPGAYLLAFGGTRTYHRLACAIEDAGWIIRDCLVWAYAQGFPKSRANLKPAWEPIVMARKPGPLRELDIEGCRIGERWPANLMMTDPMLNGYSAMFLIPKASRGDREPLLPGQIPTGEAAAVHAKAGGIRNLRCRTCGRQQVSGSPCRCEQPEWEAIDKLPRENTHPTVKPLELMRHLVRLVTPQGGTVLDPFLGSGTTALAAEQEGFAWIGIEREAEYVAIAEARLALVQRGLGI